MRSLRSLHENRACGPQNFGHLRQNDFCNTIGTKRTSGDVRSSVASEGKADMARRPSLVANDRNGLQRMISSQRRLGPEISQSLHSPSAMRNLDLAKCQLGTKPPG